jgi:hypothetical protein
MALTLGQVGIDRDRHLTINRDPYPQTDNSFLDRMRLRLA